MTRVWVFAPLAVAMGISASPAFGGGGTPFGYPVTIQFCSGSPCINANTLASMGYVARQTDQSSIGCDILATTTGVTLNCEACNGSGCSTGNNIQCTSTDANYIQTFGMVVSDATLAFSVSSGNSGTCSELATYAYSNEQPKGP